MQTPAEQVLTARALNRALLARQMLLERTDIGVATAIEHLVGLQAQVPSDPYFGLWSRIAAFDPADLSALIESRKAVRMASLRSTIHLTSAEDARMLRPWVQPLITRLLASTPFGKKTRGVDVERLVAIGRKAVDDKPMTLAELRATFAEAFPAFHPLDLSYVFHYMTPLVQVPPRGLWGKAGRPKVTTLESWLGMPLAKPSPEAVMLRYLAAYGPAGVADARAWSGLSKLAPVFDKLRPKLVTFRDEAGRELFDLPEAPRPDPDTPAPPRFLPVYDNVVLGLANRDRILRGGPATPPPQNANVRAFLLDGFVAGFWRIDEAKGRATLTIEPFGKLTKKDKAALTAEGRRLLAFATEAGDGEVRVVS